MVIDKADIKLPERVEKHTCKLLLYSNGAPEQNPDSRLFQLMPTSVEEILKVRSNSLSHYVAFPNVYAIRHDDSADVLMVWPKPNKSYTGIFEYCPARKQI